MKCPVDGSELTMSERQGVEIDYCPQCRGVWLDRGELDKIIERGEQSFAQPGSYEPPSRERYSRDDDDDDDDRRQRGGRRKKQGWLGDMFELGE